MAMLTALSFVAVAFIRIPAVLFLSYEPKDVLLTIGGFLFGPLAGALIGLVCGIILTTAGMLLWNYMITPLYMEVSREQIAGMLLPIFAPFNLLKGGINAALTMLLYKPVSSALRSARLLPPAEINGKKSRFPIWLVALFAVATLLTVLLVWSGII